jgi:hypothetical protein
VASTFLDNRVLWVGPGMGDIMYYGPWPATLDVLSKSEDPLRISQLKLLDLMGIPKIPFGDEYAKEISIMSQETEQGDFFQETDDWDIIILDRLEAWQLGRHFWPTLSQTPYDLIAYEWEVALKKLRPFQVWVRHDGDLHSTITPNLSPEYELVVDIQTLYGGFGYGSTRKDKNIRVSKNASFWSKKALQEMEAVRVHHGSGTFEYLHVWQLK